MSLARDSGSSSPRNRARDLGCPANPSSGVKYANTGTIYYESQIGSHGYDGWRPVQMGVNDQANPPIGLSPTFGYGDRDSHSLKLSTGERAYASANRDNQCTTWRGIQLSTIKERFVKYSVHFALHDGTFSNSIDSFAIALDMQNQANTRRSLAQLLVRATNVGDLTHPYSKLSITGDGPSHTPVDITGGGDQVPGMNEGKQTMAYMALVWDRLALPNAAGLGGYHSMQVGGTVFDLTASSIQTAVGSSSEPCQLPDPAAHTVIEDFRDTLNMGLILNRQPASNLANTYPATAKVSGIVLSGHDAA